MEGLGFRWGIATILPGKGISGPESPGFPGVAASPGVPRVYRKGKALDWLESAALVSRNGAESDRRTDRKGPGRTRGRERKQGAIKETHGTI